MIQQLQEQYTPEGTLSKVTKVKRACDMLNNLYSLQSDIQKLCGVVCHEALQGDGVSLQKATDRLADKVSSIFVNITQATDRLADKVSSIFINITQATDRLADKVSSIFINITRATDRL